MDNLTLLDQGLKTLTFDRYKTILGISDFDKDIAYCPKDVAQRQVAEKKGEATLEFINIWRGATRRSLGRERTSLARRGIALDFEDPLIKKNIKTVKTMPVALDYSIWFWSLDLDKLNSITSKFVFWKHQDPNLNLYYDTDFKVEYDLTFGDIVEESPIDQMYDKGRYFVVRGDVALEGWIFDEQFIQKAIHSAFIKVYDDVDPGGVHERDILLLEKDFSLV